MSRRSKAAVVLSIVFLIIVILLLKYPKPVTGEKEKSIVLSVPPSHLWLSSYVTSAKVETGGGDLELVLKEGGRWKDYVVMPYYPELEGGSIDTKIWLLRGKIGQSVTIDSEAVKCLRMHGVRINVPYTEVGGGGIIGFAGEFQSRGQGGKVLLLTECDFDLIVKTARGASVFDEVSRDLDIAFSHVVIGSPGGG